MNTSIPELYISRDYKRSRNAYCIECAFEYFVQASDIKNSIGGLCGFPASLASGALVKYIQGNGNMILNLHIYAPQVLSAISLVLTVGCFLIAKFVVEKQKVMKQ